MIPSPNDHMRMLVTVSMYVCIHIHTCEYEMYIHTFHISEHAVVLCVIHLHVQTAAVNNAHLQ
jgi:hypothetical protein